jgi:hypothetical protein
MVGNFDIRQVVSDETMSIWRVLMVPRGSVPWRDWRGGVRGFVFLGYGFPKFFPFLAFEDSLSDITCCHFLIVEVTEVQRYPQGGVSLLLVNWNYSYK